MDELGIEIEEGENCLPETAAAVFHPSVQIVHPGREEEEGDAGCGDSEKSPFLRPQGTLPDGYFPDWHEEDRHQTGGCTCCSRGCCCGYDALKAGAGLMSAGLLCPLLLWGGYALLPFDAPLLKDAPQRLVYTLHCATFATVPILLGVLVQGLCRLCPPSLTLRREDDKEPTLHQRFVNDSVGLFLLFFLNLAALSTYLSQEYLKLVPLLTSLFAMGRLVYWLAFALGSSFRSLGFGLTFFPIPAMLVANMYFMFVLEGSSIFALEPDPDAPGPTQAPSPGKQRFWG
ncbi:TMM79 protein, partial [Amia calva]|nr:TMM79 protein [Amia calva]